MAAKIDAYIDCASLYSYFGFLRLRQDRAALKQHGIEIEFHPVFLGGIKHATGNEPPWKLKAKAKYLKFDQVRAARYFNTPRLRMPDVFPIVSLLPLRCLAFAKSAYGAPRFEEALLQLFIALWEENTVLSEPEALAKVLKKTYSDDEVKTMMEAAATPETKQKLQANTDLALKRGAFGAPWLWVRNKAGKEEPFFGSDRFHFLYDFLELPWDDIAIRSGSKL